MGGRSKLGDLEELALLCVRRLGEQAGGADIRAELEELAGRDVSVSTVYVASPGRRRATYSASPVGTW